MLHCRELGMNAMVVLEQYSELDLLLSVSRRLGEQQWGGQLGG